MGWWETTHFYKFIRSEKARETLEILSLKFEVRAINTTVSEFEGWDLIFFFFRY